MAGGVYCQRASVHWRVCYRRSSRRGGSEIPEDTAQVELDDAATDVAVEPPAPSDGVEGDNAFHRRLFVELSLAEQDAYLHGLRDRRLAAVRKFQAMQELKQQAKDARTRKQVDDCLRMLQKELDAAEKALDKVEVRANKLQALRLMVEGEA